ncbi:hypothetical protein AAKU67_004372 [Oxalobacteraceae bacterium GrIS 2.11]
MNPIKSQDSPVNRHQADLDKVQAPRPNLLTRFANHKYGHAAVNFTAGVLVFAGGMLCLTGCGLLPGLILIGVGITVSIANTALSAHYLEQSASRADHLEMSAAMFVSGIGFPFTLSTVALINLSLDFSHWLLSDPAIDMRHPPDSLISIIFETDDRKYATARGPDGGFLA